MEQPSFDSMNKNNSNSNIISDDNTNYFASFSKIQMYENHDLLSHVNLVSPFDTNIDNRPTNDTCPNLLTDLNDPKYPTDNILNLNQPEFTINDNNTMNIDESQLTETEKKMKKRAQNRAAQKAFRERKANRMKELEEQLKESERNRQMLLKEIDDLKKLNMEIKAENRILLQNTSNLKNPLDSPDELSIDSDNVRSNVNFTFPTKEKFYETMVISTMKNNSTDKAFNHENYTFKGQSSIKGDSHFTNEIGQQFLTVPATWTYLSKLSETKDFDMYFVMQSLKGNEVCDEHGPSYPKTLIDGLVARSSEE